MGRQKFTLGVISPQQRPPLTINKPRGILLHSGRNVGGFFCLFLDGTEEPFYCSCKSQPRFKSQKGQQDMHQCSKVENTNGVQAQNTWLHTVILPVMCAASAARRDT